MTSCTGRRASRTVTVPTLPAALRTRRERPGHPVGRAIDAHEHDPLCAGPAAAPGEDHERHQIMHPPGAGRRVVAVEIGGIEPPAVGLVDGAARIVHAGIFRERPAGDSGLSLAEQIGRDHGHAVVERRADVGHEGPGRSEQSLLAQGVVPDRDVAPPVGRPQDQRRNPFAMRQHMQAARLDRGRAGPPASPSTPSRKETLRARGRRSRRAPSSACRRRWRPSRPPCRHRRRGVPLGSRGPARC